MDNRFELTDEDLRVTCGAKLYMANAAIALMFGTTAWIPVSGAYAFLQIYFWHLPSGGQGMAITVGSCVAVAVSWGIIAAERYREISVSFNRLGLKVYKDNIVRTQLSWDDIDNVVLGMPVLIRSKSGVVIELPSALLISERYENRVLKMKLYKLQRPAKPHPVKRYIWIGGFLLAVGIPMFCLGQKPPEVFAQWDGHSGSVWIELAPVMLGASLAVVGLMVILLAACHLSAKRQNHPFEVTYEGIREGHRVIPWADIERITRLGWKDMQIQLRLNKGQTRLIDCNLYSNGTELRDSILFIAPPSTMAEPSLGLGLLPGQSISARSWVTQMESIGCLGLFALASLSVGVMAATGRMALSKPSDVAFFEVLSLLIFLLFGAIVLLTCYQVDLDEQRIRLRRPLFRSKQIELAQIQTVEIRFNSGKNGPYDVVTVRGQGVTITFSSSLEKFGEIRDAILCCVPPGNVRRS